MNQDWKELLKKHGPTLRRSITAKQGLYAELKRFPEEFQIVILRDIWDEPDSQTRIDLLLDHVKRGGAERFEAFCTALRESAHGFIVETYLTPTGDQKDGPPACGDQAHSPNMKLNDPDEIILLDESCQSRLRKHGRELLNCLDTGISLMNELDTVFTEDQIQSLKDARSVEKISLIIDMLERGSMATFKKFCIALINSNQAPLARLLSPDKVSAETTTSKLVTEETQIPSVKTSKQSLKVSSGPPHDSSDVSKSLETKTKFIMEKLKDAYPLTKNSKRGRALIINNIKFQTASKLSYRDGAECDGDKLKELFEWLDFTVDLVTNLTAEEIREKLERERNMSDHQNADCFILFILSHGESDQIYGTDGQLVSIKDITTYFNGEHCRALLMKPKLIFIQACQGDERPRSVPVNDDTSDVGATELTEAMNQFAMSDNNEQRAGHHQLDASSGILAALEDNIMVVLATVEAFRYEIGSLFVHSLCGVFKEYADKKHVYWMIEKVEEGVKTRPVRIDGKIYLQKCDVVHGRLSKRVYLLPRDLLESCRQQLASAV